MSHSHVSQSVRVDDDLASGAQRKIELHTPGRANMLVLVDLDALKQGPSLRSLQDPAFIETDS